MHLFAPVRLRPSQIGYTTIITKLSRSPPVPANAGSGPIRPPSGSTDSLLLIEDDVHIAQLVAAELQDAGSAVDWSSDAKSGLTRFAVGHFSLIILDLNLPDLDGLQVCQQIRATDRTTPILMLTARATKQDVVRGLELGADDYLTKPFDTLELIARIRALLRRADVNRKQPPTDVLPPPIRRGVLLIDEANRETRINGRLLELTAKEFDLLLLFAKHPGRLFTRDELLTRVWGDGFVGYEHTVNTHINRLRSKVEKDAKRPAMIETVWGVGYRFAAHLT
jgi:DNA-binding response OmpR family regulator